MIRGDQYPLDAILSQKFLVLSRLKWWAVAFLEGCFSVASAVVFFMGSITSGNFK